MLHGPSSPLGIPHGLINEVEWCFDEPTRTQLGALQMKIDEWIIRSPAAPPHTVGLIDRGVQHDPRIFLNGNPATKGKEIPRQFLSVLAGPSRRPFQRGSGRLELARSIASADNPLTARVLVNRVWLHHFGSGLVSTPSDFGLRSEPPTHPELLDWLARRFVADGWSLKKLHRLIMLSHAWQQSSREGPQASRLDPANRFLSRMNRRRLDYEALRDSLLAVSGALDQRVGGRPEMVTSDVPGRRRGVYSFVDRLNIPAVMRVFDVASPDVHSPQRHETTVPQQALYLLNSPFMLDRARSLASRREVAVAAAAEDRVDVLYRLAFARPATARERELGTKFVRAGIAAPIVVTSSPWKYGQGRYDAAAARVADFRPFDRFTGSAWQASQPEDQPDRRGMLAASGGRPGSDPENVLVRRWVAPADATVTISGKIEHVHQEGDGVRAIIVSSRGGELAAFNVHHSSAETTLGAIKLRKGDTLDFLVACLANAAQDDFTWAPVIRAASAAQGKPTEWNAAVDFNGPSPLPLTALEKYAQVLLLANEFAFVD